MAHAYAAPFYSSQAWKRTREAYGASVGWVCERCGRPATIVHHRRYLTPENIGDPSVSLDWGNLEALCQACHNKEHSATDAVAPGLMFDADGELVRVGAGIA